MPLQEIRDCSSRSMLLWLCTSPIVNVVWGLSSRYESIGKGLTTMSKHNIHTPRRRPFASLQQQFVSAMPSIRKWLDCIANHVQKAKHYRTHNINMTSFPETRNPLLHIPRTIEDKSGWEHYPTCSLAKLQMSSFIFQPFSPSYWKW